MKKKSKNAQMKELKSALHYWQGYGRIYRRWVRDANAKVKEITEQMRRLQNGLPT